MMNNADDAVPTKQEIEDAPAVAEMPLQNEPKLDDVTFFAHDFELEGVSFDFKGESTIRIKAILPDDISFEDKKFIVERAGISDPDTAESVANLNLDLYLDFDENGASGVLKASWGRIDSPVPTSLKEIRFDLNESEINSANQVAEKALGHSVETERDALRELAETLFEKSQDDRDIAE